MKKNAKNTNANVTVNNVVVKEEITMSKKEIIEVARNFAVEIAKDLYGMDLEARLAGVGESLATWEPEKVTKTFVYFAMDDPWSDGEIGNDLEVRVRRENLETQYRLYHFFCDEPEDNGWCAWSKWVPLDSDEYTIPANEDTVIASDEEMAADFKVDMIDAAIDAAAASVSVGDLEITKDNAPAFEEPVVEKKEETVVDEKVRNRRLLLNLLCYRWVAENRLFFKSNKYKKGGEFCYIASRKRQLGVTCKVLKDLGWQANPATLDRVAEILREEGLVVSATRDVYIPTPMWEKLVSGKQFLDKKKGNKDIVTYLKEVI